MTNNRALIKQISQLAIPVVFANITLPLQGLIDVAIMGHLENSNYLSAVGICSQLFVLLLVSFNFLQYANSGLAAQAKGLENHHQLKYILHRGLFIAFGLGLILIIFQSVWVYLGLTFFSPSEEVAALLFDYYQIRIWGAPIELSIYVSIGWLAGQGKTGALLYQQLVISMSNVILNLIFVVGFNLDVVGVALGTLIANGLGFIYAVLVAQKYLSQSSLSFFSLEKQKLFNWVEIKQLFSLNRDILIRTVILVLSFAWITKLSTQQGEIVLAANLLLMQLIYISAHGLDGIAVAAESLVGQAYSQKNINKLKQLVRLGLLLSIVLALMLVGVFVLIKPIFIHQMTDLMLVRESASQYYYYAVFSILVGVFAYLFDGVMFGLTQNQAIRNTMLLVGVIFFPMSFILEHYWLNMGVWLSIYVLFLLRTLGLYYFYKQFLLRTNHGQ